MELAVDGRRREAWGDVRERAACLDGFSQTVAEASVKVLGYPYSEVTDRFDLMRDRGGREIYVTPPRN